METFQLEDFTITSAGDRLLFTDGKAARITKYVSKSGEMSRYSLTINRQYLGTVPTLHEAVARINHYLPKTVSQMVVA